MTTGTQTAAPLHRGARGFACFQLVVTFLSFVTCAGLALCYACRWPGAVAITVFPVWAWAAVGLLPSLLSVSRQARRRSLAVLGAWVVLVLAFAEEPRALWTARRQWPDPQWLATREEGTGWRIVSVNCAGGNALVVEEALAYRPDILLLQETPSEPELEGLIEEHPGYSLVWGYDASIIARGDVKPLPVPREHHSFVTMAGVWLGDRRVTVIDTRLFLPYCDPDIWRPGAWRQARETYESRAEQMAAVAAYSGAAEGALIVGGDFNTPPGDSLFRKLPTRLRDSFRVAGIGLGNTIINEIPISRIDQIWVSDGVRVTAVVARKTQHSDHRLVVCDVLLE